MKFRRHGNRGFRWGVVFEWLRASPKKLGFTTPTKNLVAWIGPVGGKRRSRVVTAAALIAAFTSTFVYYAKWLLELTGEATRDLKSIAAW